MGALKKYFELLRASEMLSHCLSQSRLHCICMSLASSNPHWPEWWVMVYGLFYYVLSIKKAFTTSSGDIKRLIMMKLMKLTFVLCFIEFYDAQTKICSLNYY
jgi:hypothetical protein